MGGAGSADAKDIDSMRDGGKSIVLRKVGKVVSNGSFKGRSRDDVEDRPARFTDEVVMVIREGLLELITSKVAATRDALDDRGGLEVDEVAIGGTSR